MRNFKKETLNILKENHLTWEDVEFIQTKDFCIKDKDKFLEQMDFDYDAGYGTPEIQEDLVIVGKDWWLERHEYDGSEWWEFKKKPVKLEKEFDGMFKRYCYGAYKILGVGDKTCKCPNDKSPLYFINKEGFPLLKCPACNFTYEAWQSIIPPTNEEEIRKEFLDEFYK